MLVFQQSVWDRLDACAMAVLPLVVCEQVFQVRLLSFGLRLFSFDGLPEEPSRSGKCWSESVASAGCCHQRTVNKLLRSTKG